MGPISDCELVIVLTDLHAQKNMNKDVIHSRLPWGSKHGGHWSQRSQFHLQVDMQWKPENSRAVDSEDEDEKKESQICNDGFFAAMLLLLYGGECGYGAGAKITSNIQHLFSQ